MDRSERSAGDVYKGYKRNRREESSSAIRIEEKDIKQKYRLIRERTDNSCVYMSLDKEFDFDPPNLAQHFDFAVDLQNDVISDLCNKIKISFFEGQLEETHHWAEVLGNRLTADPRLGKLLQEDFLKLIVLEFLANQNRPELQCYAAKIMKPAIAFTTNRTVIKQYITPSIILNFVHSKDQELQMQAMWLLRTIALGIPDYSEIKTVIEGAFEALVSFLKGSTNYGTLLLGIKTLGAVCQVHPLLPRDKIMSAIVAFTNLMNYEIEEFKSMGIVPHACSGIAYLCDGNKAMVVQDDLFEKVIECLIVVIDSDIRINIIFGLIALGSIVRWASDYYIEILIQMDVLRSLECLICEDDKYFVMDSCWILSNITARKESFVEAVMRCGCIESLVNVVENYPFLEVKKEAAWAILNAIYVANPKQIEVLRISCCWALWNFSKVFSDDADILYVCLEILVILEVVNVTHNGKSVDDFKDYLSSLRGRPFILADDDDINGLPKSKKLRTTENIGKYDGSIGFLLTCTLEDLTCTRDPHAEGDAPIFNFLHIYESDSANVLED